MRIQISKNQLLTKELILKVLQLHSAEETRKMRLNRYYMGENDIKYRVMNDAYKPNNKTQHSYGNYITNTVVGYFMGKPVVYNAAQEDQEFLARIKEIFDYNDEQSENIELSKDASKFGVAYELCYLDEDANIRFKRLDATKAFPIYYNTLDEELAYFVRYYNDDIFDENTKIIEIYSENEVVTYRQTESSIEFIETIPHSFGLVPVAVYSNNEEWLGDYELVISLIDAYDKMYSDSVNDFEQFADAYMVMEGMDLPEGEEGLAQLAAMRNSRLLSLPAGGSVSWLVKSVNDTYFQNTIKGLDEDIHKFAMVPNMMDESFGGNLSGIAIKYKTMGLEDKVAVKESHFKKGLRRRIELISNILYKLGSDFDYLKIKIMFQRNLPVNEAEKVAFVKDLNGVLSDSTLISLLPFIDNPSDELDKLRDESANAPELTQEPVAQRLQ
jgi:SPP1 family phage portal protein